MNVLEIDEEFKKKYDCCDKALNIIKDANYRLLARVISSDYVSIFAVLNSRLLKEYEKHNLLCIIDKSFDYYDRV